MRTLQHASLTEAEGRVLERLVERMREQLDLRAVWLYGSRARGDPPRPGSDIDVLVITRGDSERDFDHAYDLLYDVATNDASPVGFSVQVHDEQWLERRHAVGSFYIREVDHDKVVLFETR